MSCCQELKPWYEILSLVGANGKHQEYSQLMSRLEFPVYAVSQGLLL